MNERKVCEGSGQQAHLSYQMGYGVCGRCGKTIQINGQYAVLHDREVLECEQPSAAQVVKFG